MSKLNEVPENYIPNFMYIKMDDTCYWDSKFVQSLGENAKIISTYIYDSNSETHCCEFTPSYELYYAGTEFIPGRELSDEENQDAFEYILKGESETEHVMYMHCSFVEKNYIPKPVSSGFSYKGQEELTPQERMEEILEYFQGNPW
jgi:hypothetical protein